MRFCLLQVYIRQVCFYTPGKIHALNGRSDSTPMKLTLFERVMTTKRDRKKRVFRSTMHSVIFLRCVLTIFWLRTKVCSLICPQFLLSHGRGLAVIKPWWGRCQTQKICKICLLLRSLYDRKTFQSFFFDFRVLGQQCKAYFSSTAFQRVFFSEFFCDPQGRLVHM